MKKTFVESAVMISLSCALFCIGFATARIIAIPPNNIGDVATWVSAVGTLLAFGGTLWIASDQIRFRTRQRREAAMIAAEAIRPQITSAIEAVDHVLSMIQVRDTPIYFNKGGPYRCAERLSVLELWEKNHLLHLAPLPNECAFKLSRASSSIRIVTRVLHRIGTKLPLGVSVEHLYEIQLKRLNLIRENLNSAMAECNKAAIFASDFV
jgi:hypothetical protein